jgi:hypothetical protein
VALLKGEILVLDGLTRDEEHVVTNAVHDVRMLQMSLNAMSAAGIGYTLFTYYPTFEGETGAIRTGTPYSQYFRDAEVKIVNLIIRCNDQRNKAIPLMYTPYTLDIPKIIDLKRKIEHNIAEVEETRAYAGKNPAIKRNLTTNALIIPPLYLEILDLKHSYEIKAPINQDRVSHEKTLEIEKDVDILDNRWKEVYDFHDSNEPLSMVYKDD